MKSLGQFKRGDSFAFYANITDKATGNPVDTDVSNLKSQVRNPLGKLYATLTVSKSSTVVGRYFFQATKEVTALWPASNNGVELHIDVEISLVGVASSTETFSIIVLTDVTKEVV